MAVNNLMAYLGDLPQLVGQLAAATVHSSEQLVARSLVALGPDVSPLPALYAVRRSQLCLDFSFTRKQSEVVLFFIKREKPEQTLLQGQLRIGLEAVAALPQQVAAEVGGIGAAPLPSRLYQLRLPSFLWPQPTAAELLQYAPPGAPSDPIVLLRLGQGGGHVLGLRQPAGRATGRFTSSRAEDLPDRQGKFSAQPFLELAETLRAWLAGEQAERELLVSNLGELFASRPDVAAMVDCLVAGFEQLEQVAAQPPTLPSGPAALLPLYAAQPYEAEVQLLLDDSGHFAAPTSENPVALLLRVQVERQASGLLCRLAIAPPDFLLTGELRDAFLSALGSATAVEGRPAELQSPADWSRFVSAASGRAVIFRTERRDSGDRDAFVLTSGSGFSQRSLIVVAEATVDRQQQPVGVTLSGLRLVYDSLVDDAQPLDDKTIAYFLRLASALHSWLG